MRVPILVAGAASIVLFALPAVALGWMADRDDAVVTIRQCPLPARAAAQCRFAVAPPVSERVVRGGRREAMAAWRAGRDRDMSEDHGAATRRDEAGGDVWVDRGRAFAGGAMHHEDEDRRGWDDHESAQRDGGLQPDSGDPRAHVYAEQRGRAFAPGEHWLGTCGCGPARRTAADQS